MTRAYTDEAFIWKDLKWRASKILVDVCAYWRAHHDVPSVAFAWPSVGVRGDDGETIRQVVTLEHADESALRALAARTKAYALLLVDRRDGAIRVLLESAHGSACWRLPLERHGDAWALGEPTYEEDRESFGLLWRP